MSTMNSSGNVAFPTAFSTTSRSSMLPAYPTPAPTPTPSPISPVSTQQILHKEVGLELLERERIRHRKKGEVPYPQDYNSLHMNFDIIDHFMLKDLFGGLTLKPLPSKPKRVLDLGCGGGLWILEAAKQWRDAIFVGFDIHRLQPNLALAARFDEDIADLAKRVYWVQGNFLERLPFPDGEFDYARIQCIGLGVPEDEWQSVIEEMVRVLKPGGTLEVIEEDLLFPCPDSPNARTPRASPMPRIRSEQWDDGLSVHPTIREQDRQSPVFAPPESDSESDDDFSYDLNTSPERSPTSSRYHPYRVDYDEREDGDSDKYGAAHSRSRSSVDTISEGRVDQRNHERMKECFLQMLSIRFINPQVTTVLPFYLQAAFAEVQTMPALKVFLPSPSELRSKSKRYSNESGKSNELPLSAGSRANPSPSAGNDEWNASARQSHASLCSSSSSSTLINISNSSDPPPTSSLPRRGSESTLSGSSTLGEDDDEATISSRARMALSRTLQMVRSCKEALWEQYKWLYSHERFKPSEGLDREDFEIHFRSWVCDMQDRIAMRDEICTRLGWPLPPRLPDPEWLEWREKGDSGDVTAFYASAKPELLRSLRGFVCRTALPIPSTVNDYVRRSSK